MDKLDKALIEIANQEIPEHHLEAAAGRVRAKLFTAAPAAPDRLRGCADFQAIIPAYIDRTLSAGKALLLQDHTRECVACRGALNQARAGAQPMLARPVTPPSRTLPKAWAIAAAVALTAGLGIWIATQTFAPRTGEIAVQNVTGTLYLVSDKGAGAIFAGKTIAEGQRVKTAKDSTAIVRLPDGSLVEMNERSELAVLRPGRGTQIRLDRGNIIVQAAKQRSGTLDVLTADCTVSVKGTVFAVDRGTKGSRVSVVEGSVKVDQGSQSQLLKPGQQVSTDVSLQATSVDEAVSWSRDSAKYLALLGEFSIIKKGLEQMPATGLRHSSKLLGYAGRDTILYASIPNLSPTLAEAERLFRARLAESEVLRQWWDEQKDGPKLEAMIVRLRTIADYLGDEVVFTIGGNWDGFTAPMVMAEVKRPGLDAFLNAELKRLELQGDKNVPEVVALQARESDNGRRYYKRSRSSAGSSEERMRIGVRDGLVAVAWTQEELDALASRVADPEQIQGEKSMLAHVQRAYDKGVGWLMCVNMEHIANADVHRGRVRGKEAKLPAGLEAMRYLIVERKDVSGITENQATLTFAGGRSGMAGWLAEPAPMGALDFVSPNATFVVSAAMRQPQRMLSDIFRGMMDKDPDFEKQLDQLREQTGFSISPSLGDPLGGDFAFAVDGPLLPLPSWKLAVEVYNPEKLQWTIEQLVQAFNKEAKCQDCQVRLTHETAGNRVFYTVSTDKISYEIHYVFVDGYLLVAPSRTLLTKAIQNRETGYVLSRSEAFRKQLPRNGKLDFSAIIYHNVGSAVAPLAGVLAPQASPAQRQSIQALADNSAPGLIYAYGEPEQITVATNGTFFGLDLNSLALPNLIGQMVKQKGAGTRVQ